MEIRDIKKYDAYCYLCGNQENLKLIEGENGNVLRLCGKCMRDIIKKSEEDTYNGNTFIYNGGTFVYDGEIYKYTKDVKGDSCIKCAFRYAACAPLIVNDEIPNCKDGYFVRVKNIKEEVE